MATPHDVTKRRTNDLINFNTSDRSNVTLDVAATVFRTLQSVATASPIPGLKLAADLALQITTTVQKVKGNKVGFQSLAKDAMHLVYVVLQSAGENEVVPSRLTNNLDTVLISLLQIKEFAERGASRSRFLVYLRAGVDAGQIQEYRQKLQTCLNHFGFQTDIDLHVMVHKLILQHKKLFEFLENEGEAERGGVRDANNSLSGQESGQNIWQESGDGRNVLNMRGNTCTAVKNKGRMVIYDNSVHLGPGCVDFAGAYGINIGGSSTVSWNMG